MKKIVAVVLVAALVFGAVSLLKKRKNSIAETPTAKQTPYRVRTVVAQPRYIVETSTFLAKREMMSKAEISSKLSGRISEILVSESMPVKQGEPLVRIDDTEISTAIQGIKAQLRATRKQLKYSKSQYDRNRVLYDAGGLAREKLDASEVSYSAVTATVTDLEQKLKGLTNQLDYLHIKAPFDGIVGSILLHQGDLALPGKPILVLHSLSQKLTFSFVPGRAAIQPGQDVLLNNIRIGTVSTLYDNTVNGLTVAEVSLNKQIDRRPGGSFQTIAVVTKRASGCSVPVQALLHRTDSLTLMLYQNDKFNEQQVSVSARDKNFALITPCVTQPVAVGAEAKLSLLPTHGSVTIFSGQNNE